MSLVVTKENYIYAELKHGKTAFVVATKGNMDGVVESDLKETMDSTNHLIVFVCGISAFSSHTYSFYHLSEHLFGMDIEGQQPFTVLRYDMYGRGNSSNPKIAHSAEVMVGQLKELLDRVIGERESKPRLTIVGFSMGGALSTLFTSTYPDMVTELILFSPAGTKWKLPPGSGLVKIPLLGKAIYNMVDKSQSYEDKMKFDLFDLDDETAKKRLDHALEMRKLEDNEPQSESFINSFKHFPLNGCQKEIVQVATMDKKLLVIWALFDNTVPSQECFPKYYQEFSKNKQAQFVLLNNTRHMFFMEREVETAQIIMNFLRGLPVDENVTKQKVKKEKCKPEDNTVFDFFVSNKTYNPFIL